MVTCYYYACDLSYFDVVLCPSLSQILATNAQISFSCKPRPTQCLLAQVPKVTPSKNPRSANAPCTVHRRHPWPVPHESSLSREYSQLPDHSFVPGRALFDRKAIYLSPFRASSSRRFRIMAIVTLPWPWYDLVWPSPQSPTARTTTTLRSIRRPAYVTRRGYI